MSSHRSVGRIAAILDVVARAPKPLTLTEIAHSIDAPVSSTADLLDGLEEHGWLVVRERGYRVGAAPIVLDLIAHGPAPLPQINIDAWADQFNLSAALAVRVGHHIVYTGRSRRLIRGDLAGLVDEHVPRRPLTTAAGRLLLALAPESARVNVLRAARRESVEAAAAYERDAPRIARARVAWSDGLSDPEVAAVAVTPPPDNGEVALVFFGDRSRDRKYLRQAVAAVRDGGTHAPTGHEVGAGSGDADHPA